MKKMVKTILQTTDPNTAILKNRLQKTVASSQFHDGVGLKTLPTLLEVFLRHLSYCRRKAFHDDGYEKINELFNFNCNLVLRFKNLRDTDTALCSKETFLETWNSLLNNNGNYNIQFK